MPHPEPKLACLLFESRQHKEPESGQENLDRICPKETWKLASCAWLWHMSCDTGFVLSLLLSENNIIPLIISAEQSTCFQMTDGKNDSAKLFLQFHFSFSVLLFGTNIMTADVVMFVSPLPSKTSQPLLFLSLSLSFCRPVMGQISQWRGLKPFWRSWKACYRRTEGSLGCWQTLNG